MKKTYVIIGGGYTGLTAALELAEKGVDVTILEKGKILGGLASDFTVEGASLERAYHHIFKTDTDIISLARRLKIEDKIKWHNSSVSLYYGGKLYPFKGALDLLRFKPLKLHNRIRAGLTVLYLQKTSKWQKYKNISAYEWMNKYAGKEVTQVIWEPLLKGKFDIYYDKVSMAWLWARIHVRAQSREAGGEKLGYFEGGFQTFTNALVRDLINKGVKIKTNVSIESIVSSKDSVIIRYDGKSSTYNSCIATVPSSVFAQLVKKDRHVKAKYLSQLNSIKYLGARVLIFSSNQELSTYYWHNINDLNLPFLVFINHTRLISKSNYNGKYIYYMATYVPHDHNLFVCSEDKLKKVWFSALKTVFPSFSEADVSEVHSFSFSNAQHIVDAQYKNKIPAKITPLPNVFLSNFSQIYPEDRGTNYAVRDGVNIAKIALGNKK